jgi:hypothetical protein
MEAVAAIAAKAASDKAESDAKIKLLEAQIAAAQAASVAAAEAAADAAAEAIDAGNNANDSANALRITGVSACSITYFPFLFF